MSYTPPQIPVLSTANSSTATLTIGSVFTGTSEDALKYSLITVSVIANVASATDGLSIQQSPDGTNWDISDTYTIPAATGKTFSVPRQERYFRVVYTNGGVNQASFRLQTLLTPISGKTSSQRPSDSYSNEFDAEQMLSFGMVWNGATWDRARGDLDVAITGQGSQTALNQNVVLATAGTGSTDTLNGTTSVSFRSIAFHVVPASGTVTAGVITFEGSNDNFVSTALPVFLVDAANVTAAPVTSITLVASTPRYFRGAIPFRYFRARISTGITGTTTGVQAFTLLSTVPFTDNRMTVSQPTAASLNATVASTTITSQVPGTAATNLGKARDSAIGATDTGVAILGVRRDAPAAETPVAGDYVVPQVSANGEQWVGMAASATNSPAKARDGVAGASDTGIPSLMVRRDTPTAVTPAAADWEIPQISANGEQWVRLAGELADDAAFTVATTRVVPVGFLADETATDSVDEGDAGAARMTLDRKQVVANYAHTAGGWTPHMAISAASTNATSLKASAGQVGGFQVFNLNAAARYLKFYNKASAPTVGTDTPVKVIMIPGNTAGAGAIMGSLSGVEFTTGIAYALTTGITTADTGAVAVSEIAVNIDWK